MVDKDAEALSNLLEDETTPQHEFSSTLLQTIRSEPKDNQIAQLIAIAQKNNLLYNYCNSFYVANPYLRLYPELIAYDRFTEAAMLNWAIQVEPADLPAQPIDSKLTTKLQQQDLIDGVFKRMKELSGAPKTPDVVPNFNGEKLLLLDLLALDADQRDQFIIECAISNKLLVTNARTGFLELNPGVNGKCFDFLDVKKAVKTANRLAFPYQRSDNNEVGEDFIVESETLVAPKSAPRSDNTEKTGHSVTNADKSESLQKNRDTAKSITNAKKETIPTNGTIKNVDANNTIPCDVKVTKPNTNQVIPNNVKLANADVHPIPSNVIIKNDKKQVKAFQKAPKGGTPIQTQEKPIANADKKRFDQNVAIPADALKPTSVNKQAFVPAEQPSRRTEKKAAKKAAKMAEAQKPFIRKNSVPAGNIEQQVEADVREATKRMEQLMREYQYTRPDADRGTKNVRKRGARTKHVSLCSDSYETPPQSIMSSLRDIEELVDMHGSTGLGQPPKVYARFMESFENTLNRIRRKLNKYPSIAPPSKVKVQKIERPLPVKDSFKNDLLKLIRWHNCSVNMGENWTSPEDNPAALDAVVHQLVEKEVGKLVEGVIRINAFNISVAYLTSPDTTEDTVIESIFLRQCAMHNDLVQVFAFTKLDPNRSNPSGFVTRIIEKRNDRTVIGRCKISKDKQNFTFMPTTKRVPNMFIDKKAQAASHPSMDLSDQCVYLARIIGWKDEVPVGEVYRLIGLQNELSTSNKAVLIEHKLQAPEFSTSIMDSLPSESFTIPPEEYAQRENLTADYVFTIDPATARDLDDALSVTPLPNGNYKVGVHISDVTYFIPEFSELDEVIREQATSIYLVNTVYHMLPRSLCMTCSLLPGQDKLAFSVFWELTADGEIVSTHFARTVINSCVQLAYSHAQRMIEEPQHQFGVDELPTIRPGFEASTIAEKVRLLHKLATPLRKQRFDRFCLTINQPKITFQLDEESGEPLTFERYQQMDSNWLIEEFMLLANQTVATRIYDSFPDVAILRNHSAPKSSGLEALAGRLQALGFNVDFKTPEATSRTMFRLTHDAKNSETVEAVLTELLTKPMNRAL